MTAIATCIPWVRDNAHADEGVAKIDGHVLHLEAALARARAHLPTYFVALGAIAVGGFACVPLGGFGAIFGVLTGPPLALAGYGLLRMQLWELSNEIVALRRSAEQLRTEWSGE